MRTVKDPATRKNEIIMIAAQLFMEKGYDRTSMQDVMTRAEIAKGTIYHYFKSKEDLLCEVAKMLVMLETNKRVEAASKLNSPLKKFELFMKNNRSEESLSDLHKPSNSIFHTMMLAEMTKQIAPVLASYINEGNKMGIFKCEDTLVVAELLTAGFQFITDYGFYNWDSEDVYRRESSIPTIIEKLTNAKSGAFDFLKPGRK